MKKTYVLVGCGYVFPKHLKAIKETGGELLAIHDNTHDVVGVVDSYFPDCLFFRDENLFREYCRNNVPDYFCVTTPNYNHFSQIKFGLEIGSHVVSEKPLVIDPSQLNELSDLEKISGKRIWSVLQLRLHKELLHLKKIVSQNPSTHYDVNLVYTTPRGPWYFSGTWKSIDELSGSILYNLGIHLFDACHFVFGDCHKAELYTLSQKKASGKLYLDRGTVNWFLSCDRNDIIDGMPNRFMEIDDYRLNLDAGFADLHTEVYRNLLDGNGSGIEECRPAIELIYSMKETYDITFNRVDDSVDIIRVTI